MPTPITFAETESELRAVIIAALQAYYQLPERYFASGSAGIVAAIHDYNILIAVSDVT
jgi:hypothetical protein